MIPACQHTRCEKSQNLLRKASHFKYSYYRKHDPDFRDKDEVVKVHLGECLVFPRNSQESCHESVLKQETSSSNLTT